MRELDPDLRALQEMRDAVASARAAVEAVAGYDQAQIDRLCAAMAEAGAAAAHSLGRLAVEETGIGRVHYKILKNLFGSEGVWDSIRNEKSVGVVARDERRGLLEVATPVGVIAAIIPTTNPTSTALYKALIAVKGRNAVVISPHPRARRCIGETVEVLRRAIERVGGPPDLVCCLSNPTIESTGALMKHRDVALILATGGSGLVKAAYSSGKPAYGVGPGNVPAYIDRSADIPWVARSIVSSQSFDNATLCCSEQALVLDRQIAERTLAELRARGAHLCDERETELLARTCNQRGMMNPDVVGVDPWRVAQLSGFEVPRQTSLLLAHQGGVGREWPLSIEILCPLLSVHQVDGWREGCEVSKKILHFGGLGHTMAVYANDDEVLENFFLEKPASRICANGPTAQGAVGFSTNLVPAMSLGCGPQAGNITSDNISARHLLNIKRVAFPRADWPELDRAYHERAAALSGEGTPRGCGLDGDPALGSSRGRTSVAQGVAPATASPGFASNWRGNPSLGSSADAPQTASASVPAAHPARREATRRAPTFTRTAETAGAPSTASFSPAGAVSGSAVQRPRALLRASAARPKQGSETRSTSPTAAARQAPDVGAALSSGDIQNMLSQAGSGCPMGPCKGCPHHDVARRACTA